MALPSHHNPEGPRWSAMLATKGAAIGLCAAIMPCHAGGSSRRRSVAGRLYAGRVTTGVVRQEARFDLEFRGASVPEAGTK